MTVGELLAALLAFPADTAIVVRETAEGMLFPRVALIPGMWHDGTPVLILEGEQEEG